MPFRLPLWLLLAPLVSYALIAYGRRARLREPLPKRGTLRTHAMWAFGYMGFAALSDLNKLTGGVLEQAALFALLGAIAYLCAATVEFLNRSVATDLAARALGDVGSLGYVGALAAILLAGERSALHAGFLVTATAVGWLGYHVSRLADEPAVHASVAGASGQAA